MLNQLLWTSYIGTSSLWFDIAIDVTIKGTLILLIAGILVYSFRRSAASRHLIWSLALGSFLALPLLALALPRWQVPIVPASFASGDDHASATVIKSAMGSPEYNVPQSSSQLERQPANAPPTAAGPIIRSSAPSSSSSRQQLSWTTMLSMIWLAGTVLVLGRLIIGTVNVKRIIRRADQVTDATWLTQLRTLCLQLGVARNVPLLKSDRLSMPLTSGSLKAAILLPTDADEWTSERREVVLLHELAHVKRKDCLMQLIAHLACALYWFNPLVWVVTRQLRIERERACDDHVLGLGTRASDYASHLLELARMAGSAKCPTLAAVAMAKPSHLEGRLLAILDPKLNRRGLSRATISILAVVVAVVVLPLAAIQPLARTIAKSNLEVRDQKVDSLNNTSKLEAQPQPAPKALTPTGSSSATLQNPVRPTADAPNSFEQAGPMPMPTPTPTPTPAPMPMPMPMPMPSPSGGDHDNWSGQDREKRSSDNPSEGKVIDALIEALKDPSKEVRHQAIWALGQKGDRRAVDALMAALKDEDPTVRHQAAWALGELEDKRSTAALCAALKDSNSTVRQQAAWALGQIEDKFAVEALVDALSDQNSTVRHQAAWALGQIEDHRAVPALVNALKDESESLRQQAAWALGQIEDKGAVEGLIRVLKDKSPSVRNQAAWALGQIADERATDALIAAMKDENSSVRQQAAWALSQITSR